MVTREAPGLGPPALLLGVPIDVVTMPQTIDLIGAFVADGRSSGRTHQIATVNVDFLVNAATQPDLKSLLQRSALNLADGMPVVWASGMTGRSIPERVAGADLVPLIAAESAARSWKVHFFGGGPGVADRAVDLLLSRHPGANVTADAGPMIPDPLDVDDEVIDGINAVDPDILCVALGNPKQERFIAAHAARLRCPVMIGVGGTLDMLIGDRRRAPRWIQRIGAEWIVRAVQDPARLGPRYARDIRIFGPELLRHLRAVRPHRTGDHLAIERQGEAITVRSVARSWRSICVRRGDCRDRRILSRCVRIR